MISHGLLPLLVGFARTGNPARDVCGPNGPRRNIRQSAIRPEGLTQAFDISFISRDSRLRRLLSEKALRGEIPVVPVEVGFPLRNRRLRPDAHRSVLAVQHRLRDARRAPGGNCGPVEDELEPTTWSVYETGLKTSDPEYLAAL